MDLGPRHSSADHPPGPGPCQPPEIIVPRLARGERAEVSFELCTERRGAIEAGAYEAVSSDPLGLARRSLSVSRPARCIVLPRIEPLATVVPEGLELIRAENGGSSAERLIVGTSMLRPYVDGDDLRRVHWRTTARVGTLMVRDGGDLDEPDRTATTVLLDVGDQETPPYELDRAVEVAASILSVAADESISGAWGAYRLLTTTGLDTGAQRGHENLQSMLIALAGVAASPTGSPACSRRPSRASGGPVATRSSSSSLLSGKADPMGSFSRISPAITQPLCSFWWAILPLRHETGAGPCGGPRSASRARVTLARS